MKRRIFDAPLDLIKEKKFSSLSRVSVYFLWSLGRKQPLNITENDFFYEQFL